MKRRQPNSVTRCYRLNLYRLRPMAHDPSSPPKFLVPETWAENLGRVPST